MAVIHQRAYHSFTQGLLKDHADVVRTWEATVVAWEQHMTHPCPYDIIEESERYSISSPCLAMTLFIVVTMANVKKHLAEEDHKEAVRGDLDFSTTNITPSSFITTGLDLEEIQYVPNLLLPHSPNIHHFILP